MRESISAAFDKIDLDGSGSIDADELSVVLRELKIEATREQV